MKIQYYLQINLFTCVNSDTQLVMLSHKKKEGISVILMAKGFEWDQFEGPDRQGHKSLNKLVILFSDWWPWWSGPSNWSHSNPFAIRMTEMTSFFLCDNMTSWVSELTHVRVYFFLEAPTFLWEWSRHIWEMVPRIRPILISYFVRVICCSSC